MAFNLVQAGSALYSLNTDGGASAALTLPTGVALASNRVPRFARFGNYVILVNTPSTPLTIDAAGQVRVLTPKAPNSALTLSGASGGVLTGTFLAKQTFVILDALGNLIGESDFGPLSNLVTISGQYLRAANINISGDTVTATRLYRTTDNGGTFFQWMDVDGNVTTATQDDRSDAGLGIIAAGTKGAAPDLTLIVQWAGRAWGVDRLDIDNLRFTEAGTAYAWGAFNSIPIANIGDDRFGITALIPRRDALGVARRGQLSQITGDGATTVFHPTILHPNMGCVSQESVVVWRNVAYFLGTDGVYQWDDTGVTCISDAANVRSWFATDTYFNRGMFSLSFAAMDPSDTSYRLFLCSAGSTIPDRWVEYDTATQRWYGPHKTDAFTLSCAFLFRGTNDQQFLVEGSREGYVSIDVPQRADWDAVPIDEQVLGKAHTGGDPDLNTLFSQPSFYGEPQATGSLSITPFVGDRGALVRQATQKWDLRQGRSRLFRVGQGKHAQLLLANKELNVNPVIYGYQIPTMDMGRR